MLHRISPSASCHAHIAIRVFETGSVGASPCGSRGQTIWSPGRTAYLQTSSRPSERLTATGPRERSWSVSTLQQSIATRRGSAVRFSSTTEYGTSSAMPSPACPRSSAFGTAAGKTADAGPCRTTPSGARSILVIVGKWAPVHVGGASAPGANCRSLQPGAGRAACELRLTVALPRYTVPQGGSP